MYAIRICSHPNQHSIPFSSFEFIKNLNILFQILLFLGHTSKLLNTNYTEINEEVCNGDAQKICCQFHIKMKFEDSFPVDKNIYTYHLAAFSGVRSFGGVRYGGIETCAVFACLNSSIDSCGKR